MKDRTLMLGAAAVTVLLSPQGFAQSLVESNTGGKSGEGSRSYEFHVPDDASLDLEVEIQADVSSGHDGWLFTPSVDYSGSLNPHWNLGLGASLTYANGDYMSHFFSVNRSDSVRSGLEEFDADNGFKDASLSWPWTERWHVHGIAQYRRMLGDAKDSPIFDDEGDKNQYFGAVAVTYTWD